MKARGLLAVLVVLAVVSVVVVLLRGGGEVPAAAAGAANGVEVLAMPDRARLEMGLASADEAALSAVLAPDVAAAYGSSGDASLPAGSTVRIEAARFKAMGDEATVPMEVFGPQPGRWLLLLIREPGGPWLTLGTRAP